MIQRLLFIVFFCGLISVSYAQSVLEIRTDFEVVNAPINKALDALAEKTKIDIAYSKNFFEDSPPVTVSFRQATIAEILRSILNNTDIQFKALGENRVLLFIGKPVWYTLSGYVEDNETGERVVGARVICPAQNTGAITNEYGYYSFFVNPGQIELMVRSVGFKTLNKTVDLTTDQILTLKLDGVSDLPEVLVKPDSIESTIPLLFDTDNTLIVASKLVNSSPSLNGQPDYIRVAESLPGIQAETDGFGGMSVRGNDPGQNLMLLDGTPIYVPYHLLGLYSVYNPETVKSAKIMRGNFPARYGGAVSAVLDVRTREGDLYKWHGSAEANFITTSAMLEGPIKKEKGSFFIASRFAPRPFFFEPVISRLYFRDEADTLNTTFYDLNVKANYKLGTNDRIYWSLFVGNDAIIQRDKSRQDSTTIKRSGFELEWRNVLSSLRWNHLFGKRLFLNTTFTFSQYGHRHSSLNAYNTVVMGAVTNDRYILDNRSDNLDLGVKMDFDYTASDKHTLRFGLNHNYRNFSPSFYYRHETEFDFDTETNDFDFNSYISNIAVPEYLISESALYIEDHIKLRRWYFNLGIRGSSFLHQDYSFANLEPRLLTRYSINEKMAVTLSFNRRAQYLHLIANPSIQLPNDLWLPSSSTHNPQLLHEGELALQYKPSDPLQISLTAYYRHTDNIYSYPEGWNYLSESLENNDYTYLAEGQGYSRGLEWFMNYTDAKRSLLFSYTLSKSERQFDSLNLGNRFVTNYDSPHQVKLIFYHQLSKNIQVGVNWTYQSPRPKINVWEIFTAIGVINFNEDPPGEKNTTRTANGYNRIDVNLNYTFKPGKGKIKHQLRLGAYNLLNTRNTAFYEITNANPNGGIFDSNELSSLPVLPTLAYKISF